MMKETDHKGTLAQNTTSGEIFFRGVMQTGRLIPAAERLRENFSGASYPSLMDIGAK